MDKRKLPKLRPPQPRGKRPVTVYLDPAEYTTLYEMCMARNVSGPELFRQLLREAGE